MKVNEILHLHGNINRIQELKDAGYGDSTISGLFVDNGIDISPDEVKAMYSASQKLSKKALPKKKAKQLIKDKETLTSLQLVPAS